MTRRAQTTGQEQGPDGSDQGLAQGSLPFANPRMGDAPRWRRVERWLGRDGAGARHAGPRDWWQALAVLKAWAEAEPSAWGPERSAVLEPLLRAALAAVRGEDLLAFGGTSPGDRARIARFWSTRIAEPGLERLVRAAVQESARTRASDPPLDPSWVGVLPAPLALLRTQPRPDSAALAIDHRTGGSGTRLELWAEGVPWLEGFRSSPGSGSGDRPARLVGWTTGPEVDWVEWSLRVGTERVVRTAILLNEFGVALLAQEGTSREPLAGFQLDLAPGVTTRAVPESRALALGQRGRAARFYPLGLPALDYPTDRGSLTVDPAGGSLGLRQSSPGRRRWLPAALCWDPERVRRTATWRVLTVAEQAKVCPPDVACAVRLSWGLSLDGLLIYRSLAKPASRSFLGAHTTSRLFVGRLDSEGDVTPLLQIQ